MNVIFGHAVRNSYSGISGLPTHEHHKARTERDDSVPAKHFFHKSLDVREGITVCEIRKTIRANDSVNLCLCLLQHIRIERQSQEQRVDGRHSLTTLHINNTPQEMRITYSISTTCMTHSVDRRPQDGIQTYQNTRKQQTI